MESTNLSDSSVPELPTTGQTFTFEDQILTEVDVDFEHPPEDDTSTIWSDTEEVEEGFEKMDSEEVFDMSACVFSSHTDAVYCAAIHPSARGKIVTGGGDDVAYLWEYDTASQDREHCVKHQVALVGHKDTVSSVGFNFDGTLVLTGAYDGSVKIWSSMDGSLQQTLEGPEDCEFACWHPKGNALLAGSKDGTIWMWLAHNGTCLQVFAGHDGGVTCGGFTSDGKLVVSGGEDGSVRVWAPKSGHCKQVFEGHMGHEGPVTCLVCSVQDPDLFLSGSCRVVCRHEGAVVALAWHSSLPVVATAALDNLVRLWDARNGRLLVELSGHRNNVTSLTMSPMWSDKPAAQTSQEGLESTQDSNSTSNIISDVIVSVSDDRTARVFHVNMLNLIM